MSLIDFGNSVDEVRQKLREILPLVEAGHSAVERLHDRMNSQLASFDENCVSFSDAVKAVGEASSEAGEELTQLTNDTTTSRTDSVGWFDRMTEETDRVWSKMEEGQELVKSTLEEMKATSQTIVSEATTKLDSMLEKASDFDSAIQKLQEEVANKFNEAHESITHLASEWNSAADKAGENLNEFRGIVAEEWYTRLEQMTQGVVDGLTTDTTTIGEAIATHSAGIVEFFGSFQSDSETKAGEYSQLANESIIGLKDFAENDMANRLAEGIGELVEDGLATFAIGVSLSLVTSQTGVAMSSALSPIIPEIAAAKKLTEVINAIF